MTKTQISEMLYAYIVYGTRFSTLAKQYPEENAASLKTLAKLSGFNRAAGIFAKTDCGAYKRLCPPKFAPEEIIEHIAAYLEEDETRPDMDFRQFLIYQGIKAENGTRDIPKPMPKKIWHTSQSTEIFHATEKAKKEPLDKATAVGLVVLVTLIIIGVGLFLFLRTSDFNLPHSYDTTRLNTQDAEYVH
ncbi:MAG: hypothetical protein FWC16_00450 [Defluviitaleaceae bacterium]|nr:hypothetical protein [Defluviitaleaceae bacterium]MCL2273373.1 hypothetical protein [Defluviitaleaceae bacterium]